MTRAEALKTAEELVNRLSPATNARGYTDGTAKLGDRIGAILRVADFLVESGSTPEPVDDGG